MKKLLCTCAVLLCLLPACKKSSSEPKLGDGNFIKLNDDRRGLGFIPSEDIELFNPLQYDPHVRQAVLTIKNRANNIDGKKNDVLTIRITIHDNLAKTEYNIANAEAGTANVDIDMSGPSSIYYLIARSGKVIVTKDTDGQINSVKFENLEMRDTYSATASANLVFYE